MSAIQPIAPRDLVRAAWLRSFASADTRAAYTGDIDQFFGWCDENGADVLAALRWRIDDYAAWLRGPQPAGRGGRYGNATISRKIVAVSSFYEYAVDEGVIERNPAAKVKRPRVSSRSTTRHLTEGEAHRLLDVAAAHSPRALAVVDLMLSTALRISEVCSADVDGIARDGTDTLLTVRRKGGYDDDVLIPAPTLVALREYLAGRASGPLFLSEVTGDRVTRQQMGNLVRLLAGRAGLVNRELGDQLLGPHGLRKTAATTALDQDDTSVREVQALMGHVDPRTTMRYDGARAEVARAAARTLGGVWHRDRSGK